MNENPSTLVQFVGHFHPVLVHLPIGAVIVVAALEAMALRPAWKGVSASVGPILWLTLPAAWAAGLCGWLLAEGGGYDAGLLAWHRWTGVAGLVLLTAVAGVHALGRRLPYRVLLVASVAVVGMAGHHGGSLTHGRDFLTRYAPAPLKRWFGWDGTVGRAPALPGTPASFFAEAVQPILERHCTACHGAEKEKGGLRLDTSGAVLRGGDSGPAIVAGRPAESPLLGRIRLPMDHDDHMPPSGKSQPSEAEVGVLEWWLGAGAPMAGDASTLQVPAAVLQAVRTGSH